MLTSQILVTLSFPPNRVFHSLHLSRKLSGSGDEALTYGGKSETKKPFGSVGETPTSGEA